MKKEKIDKALVKFVFDRNIESLLGSIASETNEAILKNKDGFSFSKYQDSITTKLFGLIICFEIRKELSV